MNRDNRSSSQDPTAELASDQSAQSASGLSAGRTPDRSRDARREEVINRDPLETPRRYEQPIEDDDDPVMPSDDTTLNTKI